MPSAPDGSPRTAPPAPRPEIPRSSPLGTDGVQDGKDVVHPLLERRRGRRAVPVRKPAATAVEQNQAGELRQPPQERRERRFLPEHLDVGSQPVGPHQVDRSVPHDLVGDVHLARSGVSRHRLAHCRPPTPGCAPPFCSCAAADARPTQRAPHGVSRRDGTCSASVPTGPPGPDRTERMERHGTRQGQRHRTSV